MTKTGGDMAAWEAGSRAMAREAKDRMAQRHRPPSPDAAAYAAADKIVDARMVGAGVQPRTIAGRDVEVIATDFKAIVTGKDGAERTEQEASKVLALFDRSACAVMRLAHDGLIAPIGALAALAFAGAGDRVMGGVRVRTVDLDRVRGAAGDGVTEAEKDKIARWRWDVARLRLSRVQFRILDGVMRHDETSTAAARSAYPTYSCRKKLSGMGDQALIDACGLLSVEYGFETIQTHGRSLAGL